MGRAGRVLVLDPGVNSCTTNKTGDGHEMSRQNPAVVVIIRSSDSCLVTRHAMVSRTRPLEPGLDDV